MGLEKHCASAQSLLVNVAYWLKLVKKKKKSVMFEEPKINFKLKNFDSFLGAVYNRKKIGGQ